MRSCPVKEKPIGSAVSEVLCYRQKSLLLYIIDDRNYKIIRVNDEFVYIPNDDKEDYPFSGLKLLDKHKAVIKLWVPV